MPNPPSVDLASARIPLGTARPITDWTITELKDELLRRGCADFSKWEVLVKLSPFIVLFAAVLIYKLSLAIDGTYLGCLLQ